MSEEINVFLLHNEVSPYRLPLFERLAERVNLTVYFCYNKSGYRLWDNQLEEYNFQGILGRNFRMDPFRINLDLLKVLREGNFDVYVVGGVGAQTLFSIVFTLFAAETSKSPFIFWSGAVDTAYSKEHNWLKDLLKRKLSSLLAWFSDSIIVYGKLARYYLEKLGVNNEKIFSGTQVIPFELLPDQIFQPSMKLEEKLLKKDGKIILSVSYFQKRKGLDTLIKSFNSLENRSSELVIAGTGKEENALKELAKGNSSIHFPGYVEGERKAALYKLADIFVLPTLHDPWGLVINEAMYYGLPIVTTKASGAKELVKDNGFVIPPGDATALEGALRKLLGDDQLSLGMGKKSEKYIKTYDVDFAVDTFCQAIEHAFEVNRQ